MQGNLFVYLAKNDEEDVIKILREKAQKKLQKSDRNLHFHLILSLLTLQPSRHPLFFWSQILSRKIWADVMFQTNLAGTAARNVKVVNFLIED